MVSSWLSADRLLILGVAGLGAYALYRMTRADAGKTAPEPQQLPPDGPGPAGPPPTADEVAIVAGDPIRLTNSRAYQGRLETFDNNGEVTSPFLRATSTREEIARLVESFGFEPGTVRVSMTPAEATAAGISPFAIQKPGSGTRWFYARYLGPTADVPRPRPLATLWVVRGPGARTAGLLRTSRPVGVRGWPQHATMKG